jgi:hypothetical protein
MPLEDISKLAGCTSCTFDQDLSNYWTANVYFRARNGSFKRVPQMVNDVIGNANGGITVYYTAPGPNTVTAFKPVCQPCQNLPSTKAKRGSCLTRVVCAGLPHVCGQRFPPRAYKSRPQGPELLPVLHGPQLWRQHQCALLRPAT